jgi:hypothetical protein
MEAGWILLSEVPMMPIGMTREAEQLLTLSGAAGAATRFSRLTEAARVQLSAFSSQLPITKLNLFAFCREAMNKDSPSIISSDFKANSL